MKILIISKAYPPSFLGGGEISVELLATSLKKEGHDVTVLSFDGNNKETRKGIRIIRKPFPRTIKEKLRMKTLVKELALKYDLIHAYNIFFYEYLGLLSLTTHTKIVGTINNLPDIMLGNTKNPLKEAKRWLFNKTRLNFMKRMSHFILLSQSLMEEYAKKGFSRKKMTVVPNMIDPAFLKPIVRRRSSEKTRLLFIGSLYHAKGVDVLLHAMTSLDVHLTIIGDGPEKKSLQKLSKKLGILKKVNFKGKIPYTSLIKEYDNADIFIHPGRWKEPFGRTIIEAMARGLPVVVSDQGAPPLTVGERKLVFPSENGDKLGQILEKLSTSKQERDKYGKLLRKKAEKYSPQKILPRILKVYKSL